MRFQNHLQNRVVLVSSVTMYHRVIFIYVTPMLLYLEGEND